MINESRVDSDLVLVILYDHNTSTLRTDRQTDGKRNGQTYGQTLALAILLARDSMLSALYAIARPSVCPSHGWISRKRLNVSSKFYYYYDYW